MFHQRDDYSSLYTEEREIYKKNDFYDKVKKWLKQLQPETLYKILSIEKPYFVALLLHVRAYTKLTGDKFFSLKCDYQYLKQMHIYLRPFSDNFFGFNRIMYDPSRDDEIAFFKQRAIKIVQNKIKIVRTKVPYDTVTFSKTFMDDIDAWMECFSYISENMFLFTSQYQKEDDFQQWFNPKSLNTISAWVIALMEHKIIAAYHEYNKEDIYPKTNIQRENSLIKIWKQLGKKEKQKMVQNSMKLYDILPKTCFESSLELDYYNKKKQMQVLNNFEFFFKFLCKQQNPIQNVNSDNLKTQIQQKIQQWIQMGDCSFIQQCYYRNLDESFALEKLFMDQIGIYLEQKFYTSREFLEEDEPKKKKKRKKKKKKPNQKADANQIEPQQLSEKQQNEVQAKTNQLENQDQETNKDSQEYQYLKKFFLVQQNFISITEEIKIQTIQQSKKKKSVKKIQKRKEQKEQIWVLKNSQTKTENKEEKNDYQSENSFQEQWQEYKPKQQKNSKFSKKNHNTEKSQISLLQQHVLEKKDKRLQKKIKKKKTILQKIQQSEENKKQEDTYKPLKWKEFVDQSMIKEQQSNNVQQIDEKFFFDCEIQIFIQQHTYNFLKRKFNKHLDRYYDKINKESQKLDLHRQQAITIAEKQINIVLQAHQIQKNQYAIKTYGSYPNNIQTIHSDIDISILKKNNCFENQKILDLLNVQFSSCKQVIAKKLLLQASFPVLKIDMQINQKLIQLDIIIEEFEIQQSQKSTDFVQDCIQNYPTFKQNILILKHIFGVKGFNQNYQGGLSSYPLSVIYASFLVYKNLQFSNDQTGTLLEFMKFLFHDFDHQKQMIVYSNNAQYILQQKSVQYFMYNLVVVNKEMNESNLTSNSSLYHKIKFYLYQIYSKFYKLYKQILPKPDQKIMDFNYENINNNYESIVQEIVKNNDLDFFFDINQKIMQNIKLFVKLILYVLFFCPIFVFWAYLIKN